MLAKNRWGNLIKRAIDVAHKKGLKVSKNFIAHGWTIYLPGGNFYNAETDADMVKYVRGY